MSKIIVTGGAGFIGSHLVDRLIKDKHEVIIVDNLSTGREEFINPKAKFVKANLFTDQLQDLFNGVDYVFHQAATPRIQLSLDKPEKTFKANVYATQRVLQWSGKAKVKRVIYASSSSVYGKVPEFDSFVSRARHLPLTEEMDCDPETPYATHKLMSELLCKSYSKNFGVNVIALRYFNVYGKRMSTTGVYKLVMAIWNEQKNLGQPLTVYGDGKQTRDFTYIDDVVEANVLAMNSSIKGYQVFNVCSGEETMIYDVARMFNQELKFIENPRGRWEEKRKVGSFHKAKGLLKYEPKIFIDEGVKKYLS